MVTKSLPQDQVISPDQWILRSLYKTYRQCIIQARIKQVMSPMAQLASAFDCYSFEKNEIGRFIVRPYAGEHTLLHSVLFCPFLRCEIVRGQEQSQVKTLHFASFWSFSAPSVYFFEDACKRYSRVSCS